MLRTRLSSSAGQVAAERGGAEVLEPGVGLELLDRIQYGTSEVTTDDPAMPDELRSLVARLGQLVERYEQP